MVLWSAYGSWMVIHPALEAGVTVPEIDARVALVRINRAPPALSQSHSCGNTALALSSFSKRIYISFAHSDSELFVCFTLRYGYNPLYII